jgi:transcriptional regulator with XRE-family HTH domain
MRLKERQAELRLTDRELAKAANVARSTVYRAKTGEVSRYSVMEQIASTLKFDVVDIEEFRDALRERVFREAEKQGAPPQVIDEADQMDELFNIRLPPDKEFVQMAAYSLLQNTIAYLDRSGRGDLVDRALRERKRGGQRLDETRR